VQAKQYTTYLDIFAGTPAKRDDRAKLTYFRERSERFTSPQAGGPEGRDKVKFKIF